MRSETNNEIEIVYPPASEWPVEKQLETENTALSGGRVRITLNDRTLMAPVVLRNRHLYRIAQQRTTNTVRCSPMRVGARGAAQE